MDLLHVQPLKGRSGKRSLNVYGICCVDVHVVPMMTGYCPSHLHLALNLCRSLVQLRLKMIDLYPSRLMQNF